MQEAMVGLQHFSNLSQPEQVQVMQGLCGGSQSSPNMGGRVSFSNFALYYQQAGTNIEQDREFEELLRHHWGFAEISDILDDMKNKFAMVGLAYAFRNNLESGGSSEVSPVEFQEAIGRVGMQYASTDVQRLFDAFDSTGTLEVQQFIQHLVSAPRPLTPLTGISTGGDFQDTLDLPSRMESPSMGVKQAGGAAPHDGRPGWQTNAPAVLATLHLPSTVLAPLEDRPEEEQQEEASPVVGGQCFQAQVPQRRYGDTGDEPPPAPPEQEDHSAETLPPQGLLHQQSQQHTQAYPAEQMLSPSQTPPRVSAPTTPRLQAYPAEQTSSPLRTPPRSRTAVEPEVPRVEVRKRAVTVGINYIGQQVALSTCINDSDMFVKLLTEAFGYEVACIRQLRDDHPQRMPTTKNIKAALRWLVNGAQEGDHLFFHYSGHGSQQQGVGAEVQGKDDTLVPVDYQRNGAFSAEELRRILVQELPKGARLTVVLDCCHGGTALGLPYKVALLDGDLAEIKKKPAHKLPRPSAGDVVMLCTSRDPQRNPEMNAGPADNKAVGAMSAAFRAVMSKNPTGSYYLVVDEMRKLLKNQGLIEVPHLCSEHFLDLSDPFMPEAQCQERGPEQSLRQPIRKALTIGINYLCLTPGQGRLAGCINDSDTMIAVLKDTFQFNDAQICRLRDDHPSMMPTKANILASMRWLTTDVAPGDELFMHYSGHGGRQSDNDLDQEGHQDDTLIPCDFQVAGQIRDDELHAALIAMLPQGVRMWVVWDCCHSGTALDLRYKAQLALDGRSMHIMRSKSKSGTLASKADLIMISGCKDTQTSAGAPANIMGADKGQGAMTTAFQHCVNPSITCEDLMAQMTEFLRKNSFQQVPQMSSEQFIKLDSTFVGYKASSHNPRTSGNVAAWSSPQPEVPPMQTPLSPEVHNVAHVQHLQAVSPISHHRPLAASPAVKALPSVEPQQAAMQAYHMQAAAGVNPVSMEDMLTESRIHHLEAKIAELRRCSPMSSPQPGAQYFQMSPQVRAAGMLPQQPMPYSSPRTMYSPGQP